MQLVHFTFNNFFDYSIILEKLQIKYIFAFNSNEFTISYVYNIKLEYAIEYIEDLCKPLNIQFTTTSEVTEDTEWI